MYLSYSGFKTYEQCPRHYYHKYVAKTVLLTPDNRVGMLYGSVVGTLFEDFYQEQLWRTSNPLEVLLSRVFATLDKTMTKELRKGGVFDWSESRTYGSADDVEADVRATVPRGLKIIRMHSLLGKEARAELKLDYRHGPHILGGRADFLIRRFGFGDRVLLDGKGSRWLDKYVDRRQLKWYAMLHQDTFGSLPDRVGFLYWKAEPEESVDWVECSEKDVETLREVVLTRIEDIEDGTRRLGQVRAKRDLFEAFATRPSRDCSLCSFRGVCEEGTAFLSRTLPVLETVAGVEDVGL